MGLPELLTLIVLDVVSIEEVAQILVAAIEGTNSGRLSEAFDSLLVLGDRIDLGRLTGHGLSDYSDESSARNLLNVSLEPNQRGFFFADRRDFFNASAISRAAFPFSAGTGLGYAILLPLVSANPAF